MRKKLPIGIDGFEKLLQLCTAFPKYAKNYNYGIAFYKKNCKVMAGDVFKN